MTHEREEEDHSSLQGSSSSLFSGRSLFLQRKRIRCEANFPLLYLFFFLSSFPFVLLFPTLESCCAFILNLLCVSESQEGKSDRKNERRTKEEQCNTFSKRKQSRDTEKVVSTTASSLTTTKTLEGCVATKETRKEETEKDDEEGDRGIKEGSSSADESSGCRTTTTESCLFCQFQEIPDTK